MKILKIFITVLLLVVLTACNQDKAVVKINEDELTKETFIYKEVDGNELKLDVINLGKSSAPKPVLVYIHGGGFVIGSRFGALSYNFRGDVNRYFLLQGYSVISIDYTLSNEEEGTTMADAFADGKDAIRWIKKNAEMLKINPDNIGLYGLSAGGGIATMISSSPEEVFKGNEELSSYTTEVSFVLNMYGGDTRWIKKRLDESVQLEKFLDNNRKFIEDEFFKIGLSGDEDFEVIKEQLSLLSVTTYLDYKDSPIFTMHGTDDKTVNIEASRLLHSRLDILGINNVFMELDGFGHNFDKLSESKKLEYIKEMFDFASEQQKNK